jgi:hypothetical protein
MRARGAVREDPMKRAILIGAFAMLPVAGCGSDGMPSRGSTLTDQVGGQALPSDPDNPLLDPNAPASDPDAPPAATQNPVSDSPGSAPILDCAALCSGMQSRCQMSCSRGCRNLNVELSGPCGAEVNAFLGCANGLVVVCTDDFVDVSPVNACLDELDAANLCLKGARTSSNSGASSDGPPQAPGR